jgi:hypothetical protein
MYEIVFIIKEVGIMTNKLMENLLYRLNGQKNIYKKIDLNNIVNDIFSRIIKIDDIIFINNEDETITKLDKEYILKTYGSYSAFEDVWNHIHIIDIINCNLKIIETLKYGIKIKDLLKNKLKENFFDDEFVIILTCDGKKKINTILRFYKYRENEKEIYDQKLIDVYDKCKYKTGFLVERI